MKRVIWFKAPHTFLNDQHYCTAIMFTCIVSKSFLPKLKHIDFSCTFVF